MADRQADGQGGEDLLVDVVGAGFDLEDAGADGRTLGDDGPVYVLSEGGGRVVVDHVYNQLD